LLFLLKTFGKSFIKILAPYGRGVKARCALDQYAACGGRVFRAHAARQGPVLAVGFNQSHFVKGRLVFLGNPQGRTVRQNKFWTVLPQSSI